MQDKISDALLKVALGFQIAEITEEYAEVDGQLKLTKRRRTKKDVPPDLKAVQMLLGDKDASVENMSDEELEEERNRLLASLEKENQKTVKRVGQVRDEMGKKEKTTRKPRAKPRKRVNRKKEDI